MELNLAAHTCTIEKAPATAFDEAAVHQWLNSSGVGDPEAQEQASKLFALLSAPLDLSTLGARVAQITAAQQPSPQQPLYFSGSGFGGGSISDRWLLRGGFVLTAGLWLAYARYALANHRSRRIRTT